MFTSYSNTITTSRKPPFSGAPLSDYRSHSSQKKRRTDSIPFSNQPLTRAGTAISHRSNHSQKIYSIEQFQDAKGWETERSLLSNQAANLAAAFPFASSRLTSPKKRPATSLHQRSKTAQSSNRPKIKQKTDYEDVEPSVNRENSVSAYESLRASILKDIPRMRDVSAFASNSFRSMQEKVRKVDQKYKVDLSRTFRSKFEEEVITEAEEMAAGAKKPSDMLTLKLMSHERFMINQDGQVQFRVKTENAKFPLEVRIEFLPRDAQYFFEIYVSSSISNPCLSRHDYRFLDKVFTLEYGSNPAFIYFTISALTAVNMKFVVVSKEERVTEKIAKKSKSVKHLEQYKKCLEGFKDKRLKDYEFIKYNADEMARFKEEVDKIKREKLLKNLQMAKDGRNIMKNNMDNLVNLNAETLLVKIRNRSEEATLKGEEVRKKREDLINEMRTKKIILLNKAEIRTQARQTYVGLLEKEDLKRQIQTRWLTMIATNILCSGIREKLIQGRMERFRLLILNSRATCIQKAYKKYRLTRGKTVLERRLLHIREGLNAAMNMLSRVAKERTQKIMKQYMGETCLLLSIKNRMLNFMRGVLKIQKAYRRYRLMQYFRKVCVMKIIRDLCQELSKESNGLKSTKKKETKGPKAQFFQALQENSDFQKFVMRYYFDPKRLQLGSEKGSQEMGKKKLKKKKVRIVKATRETQKSPSRGKILKKKALLIDEIRSPKTSRSHSCSSASSDTSDKNTKNTPKKQIQIKPQIKIEQKIEQPVVTGNQRVSKIPSREAFNSFLETSYKNIMTEALKVKQASFVGYFF